MRGIVLMLVLIAAEPLPQRYPVRVELQDVGCVGDQCTIKVSVRNKTRAPLQGVKLDCTARRGIREVLNRVVFDVPGVLPPNRPKTYRFVLPLYQPSVTTTARVSCEAILPGDGDN